MGETVPKIRIVLSFDHELPLGGVSKSYEEAIFTPTRKIIELAKKINVPVCLFTDIQSALFFRKHSVDGFYDKYTEQLQYAVSTGNDVQLHIHPHWLKTTYSNNGFHPTGFFNLADFKEERYPANIEGIIETSIAAISDICIKADGNYKCVAYRAGGFNLEPETKRILTSLINSGIKIESSIVKDFYYKSQYSLVNFANMPRQSNWYISPAKPLNETSAEGMLEVPVASIPAGLYTNIKHIIKKKLHKNRAYVTGKTIHSGKVKMVDKLKSVFSIRMLGFDVYTLSAKDLIGILDYNLTRDKSANIILSCLSHPKNMGPYSLKLMEEFIVLARAKYPGIEFVTYSEIAKDLR